jgi:hypothetical protein
VETGKSNQIKKGEKMKHKTRIVFVALAALALVISAFGAAAGAKPDMVSSGNVFTVYPTGVDDTQNIMEAFELAKAAGPGSTVLLAPGNFKTRLMDIWDFDGYFKGSGEGVTFLDTFADQDCQAWIDAGHGYDFIHFRHGYPRISDLTIHLTPPSMCQDGSVINVISIGNLQHNPDTDCDVQKIELVSGSVDRVTIQGDWNINYAISMGGTLTWDVPGCQHPYKFAQGEFRVTRTTITGAPVAVTPFATINSQITIGGSLDMSNLFDGVWYGIWANDHSGSAFEVSYNTMPHVYGVGFETLQGGGWWYPYLESASTFNIHHNDFTVFEVDAIHLFDFDNFDGSEYGWYPRQGKTLIANVHHNRFTLNLGYAWAMWGEWLEDAQIHHNTVEGTSNFAMAFGYWGPTRQVKIMENDLHGYVSTSDPYKIFLNWGTEDYRVTVDEEDSVLDIGTNNTVNEKINKGQFGFDAAFVEMMNQKMTVGKEFMPWDPRYQALPLLAPVNYLYIPVVQAK